MVLVAVGGAVAAGASIVAAVAVGSDDRGAALPVDETGSVLLRTTSLDMTIGYDYNVVARLVRVFISAMCVCNS